jgi:glutaredoxin
MGAESIVVELYTKQECSLCRVMRSVLRRVAQEYPLTIKEIDIEEDPTLQARFAEQVPVLYLNGRKAFKYRLSEAALRRKLMLLLWQQRLFGALSGKVDG